MSEEEQIREVIERERAREWPFKLGEPQHMPAINECLLCARCSSTFRVWHHTPDNHSPNPASRRIALMQTKDRETDAQAEMPWCPSCGTAVERERGLTFLRPVPTRHELRAALAEACTAWEAMTVRAGLSIIEANEVRSRIVELRAKFLGGE